jgi:hypothetical protein
MSGPLPDFDRLIADARISRSPVPLTTAQVILGDLFEEHLVDQETLIIPRDGPIALTPTSWVRVLRRAQTRAGQAP